MNSINEKMTYINEKLDKIRNNMSLTKEEKIETIASNIAPYEFAPRALSFSTTPIMEELRMISLKNLTGVSFGSQIPDPNLDLSFWDVAKFTGFGRMFSNASSLISLNISGWNNATAGYTGYMFYSCGKLTDIIVNENTRIKTNDTTLMFNGCKSLTKLNLDWLDTSACTQIVQTFDWCTNLEELEINTWDVSNCTKIYLGGNCCHNMKKLDLSNWHTPKLTNLTIMNNGWESMELLDIRNFDFSKHTSSLSSSFKGGFPMDCLIIVKDDTQKALLQKKKSDLTNIKTVAEYEAMQK